MAGGESKAGPGRFARLLLREWRLRGWPLRGGSVCAVCARAAGARASAKASARITSPAFISVEPLSDERIKGVVLVKHARRGGRCRNVRRGAGRI